MIDQVTDLVAVLEYAEELLEALARDGRLLLYVRDLTRLVRWLRTQPRSRAIMIGGIAAAVLVVIVSSSGPGPANSGFPSLGSSDEEWPDQPGWGRE
jgi:hypothetical protein